MRCSISVLSSVVATSHVWLSSTWNVARVVQELTFKLYLILVNLTVNSHVWLRTTTLDSTDSMHVEILHSDAAFSCILALSVACVHLATLLEKYYFLRTFSSLCFRHLEYINIGRTAILWMLTYLDLKLWDLKSTLQNKVHWV